MGMGALFTLYIDERNKSDLVWRPLARPWDIHA